MAYVNPLMKSGDLILFHGTAAVDVLIEVWTRSPFSHCGVILAGPPGLQVIQCIQGTGVGLISIDDYLAYGACTWLATGAAWTLIATHLAIAKIGRPYSLRADILVALGMTPPDNEYNCSLLAGEVLEPCGIAISRKGLSPGVLATFFTNRSMKLVPVKGNPA